MIRNASIEARTCGRRIFTRTLTVRNAVPRWQIPNLTTGQRPKSVSPFDRTSFAQRCFISQNAAFSNNHVDDTIYALSTAPGRAGIAIVRISGPAWFEVTSSVERYYQASLTCVLDIPSPLPVKTGTEGPGSYS
jgi:tRNA modification GTPase